MASHADEPIGENMGREPGFDVVNNVNGDGAAHSAESAMRDFAPAKPVPT